MPKDFFYFSCVVCRRIAETKIDLQSSEYLKFALQSIDEIKKDLGKITEIICIGIGHFSECSISRHQLAFILNVQKFLNVNKITFHEPILSKGEINILKALDCEVFEENLEGKIDVKYQHDSLTLIYAPHCPKQLSNNFIWKNWSVEKLTHIVLIANSISNLVCSTPDRFLKIDAAFIARLYPFTNEIVLPNNFKFTDIFNDTSIHTFSEQKLNDQPKTFWSEDIAEPKYSENIELITADLISKLTI